MVVDTRRLAWSCAGAVADIAGVQDKSKFATGLARACARRCLTIAIRF